MITAKKQTNADVIRKILAIDKKYSEEHPDEQILNDNVRNTLQELIDTSSDDYEINRRFNNILKPSQPNYRK